MRSRAIHTVASNELGSSKGWEPLCLQMKPLPSPADPGVDCGGRTAEEPPARREPRSMTRVGDGDSLADSTPARRGDG